MWMFIIKQKLIFYSGAPSQYPTLSIWGNKFIFDWNGSKGSRWTQNSPKWSKTLRLTILVPFGPFWTFLDPFGPLWNVDLPCLPCPFWNNSERPVDALALILEKGESLTHSLTYNLKSRDASASKKIWLQSIKNVKNRSKFHDKMAVFCHYLAMNGKLWIQKKFSTHI